MNHWQSIRFQAQELHRQARQAQGPAAQFLPAATLIKYVAQQAGIELVGVPADDKLLYNSLAVLMDGCIVYNQDLSPAFAHYCQAHELAHHFLHQGQSHCDSNDLEAFVSEDAGPQGEAKVSGYGPHELRERQANIFARELLLPTDKLRACFVEQKMTARRIAAQTGVPLLIVQHQLAHALLVAENVVASIVTEVPDAPETSAAATERPLDPSQHAAAVAPGPLLVEAGPGTGKTMTLVQRVLYLLGTGVAPESILCLTFSNKAAREMRERVARAAPDAAGRIWMGTFHAFGLELLRQYWREAGLPPKPVVLATIDAIFLLEQALPELELDYYQSLSQPTRYLGRILSAISRAKDELAGPERYRLLAQQMYDDATAAGTPDVALRALKALEVARVYAVYERLLAAQGWLDFGDLIARSVRLLQTDEAVQSAVRERFRAVLVDEYQDVNRASGVLLKLLAGDGAGLWAVGDVRQSIFRWRGASTANMRLFAQDFPCGKVSPLAVNYRSQPPVINTFSEFAPQMKAARQEEDFTPWTPHRPHTGGQVSYEVAATWDEEAAHLAAEIRRHHTAGRAYREQAVICRTHTQLNRVAAALEAENIPLLYLGDLFTRPEIRDLLALLRLSCANQGRCLVRVAQFAEYDLPLTAVRRVLRVAAERGCQFPAALSLAQELEDLDEAVKARFALLAQHLTGWPEDATAWDWLASYLFDRSDYLRAMLRDDSAAARQKRLAVYQFLQFAGEQRGAAWFSDTAPRHALLRYVRRLEMHGAGRDYAPLPEWADGLEAVRLLTVHAAKGLEFPVVYLPQLAQRYFPSPRRGVVCPPPNGLIEGFTDAAAEHEEEEQCLFFVALSRARDHLHLSRAEIYKTARSHPSSFLTLIENCLPRPAQTWATLKNSPAARVVAANPAASASDAPDGPPPRFSVQQLDLYLNCPRRYFYEIVLRLPSQGEDVAAQQYHACVYETLRDLQAVRQAGGECTEAEAVARLAALWAEKGPVAHVYAALYYRQAVRLICQAVALLSARRGAWQHPVWELSLSNGSIYVKPEMVGITSDGATTQAFVHRFRTGRPPQEEPDDALYALYLHALKQHFPTAQPSVQLSYLTTGETRELNLTPRKVKNRLAKYEAAMSAISRQEFPATPSKQDDCPACPHYLICSERK